MTLETEYKLEHVPATPVAADAIDRTFRSTTIGEFRVFSLDVEIVHCVGQGSESVRVPNA